MKRIARWISDVILGGIVGMMILMAGRAYSTRPWATILAVTIMGGATAIAFRKRRA